MKVDTPCVVNRHDFTHRMFTDIEQLHFAKDYWPIVYILSDGSIKEAYVGETTDTLSRMDNHLRNNAKSKLTTVHLITSEKFNKSATLDIESNLIKYISGDGQYALLNANIGLANHNYYQKKEVYWGMFVSIWNKLRSEGISKHSLEHIDNSDLFKYSPYKSLSIDQRNSLLSIIKGLLTGNFKSLIVNGGAGTGKTILAVFLFKLLVSDNQDFNFKEFGDDETEFINAVIALKKKYPNPRMALVVPMSSFRNTIKKVFKNIKGLNANMVIGPSEITKDQFDIVMVDEAHRLRKRVNLGAYFGQFDKSCEALGLDKYTSNELEWVILQSKKSIFFYDQNQSIKPSDVRKEDFDNLIAKADTKIEYLKSQFRVKGGTDYVYFVDQLLNCELVSNSYMFTPKNYECFLFDSIELMVTEIKKRDQEGGLSRLIAGYAWPWVSKKDKKLYDINIDGFKLRWNSVSDDYINSANALNEVGCIHTTQGYDLNYSGIIFGKEITYDKKNNQIIIRKDNYFDKNGKQTIVDINELKSFIVNIYKTILLRGIKGTYIYVCDPSLREYFAKHISLFGEPKLIEHSYSEELIPYVNSVPLFDLKVAAGNFSEVQNVDDFDWVKIPERYRLPKDFFACKVIGESMNKIIPNGSICLFRKYTGGSREGKIVLVQHYSIQESDFGSGYTVKEYHSIKNIKAGVWEHQSITLKPLSYESNYIDFDLKKDELENLRVIAEFECVL